MERDDAEADAGIVTIDTYFRSNDHRLFHTGEIEKCVSNCESELENNKDEFVLRGSGWRLKEIVSLEIKIGEMRYFPEARGNRRLKMPDILTFTTTIIVALCIA